jgi:hypothetical protein
MLPPSLDWNVADLEASYQGHIRDGTQSQFVITESELIKKITKSTAQPTEQTSTQKINEKKRKQAAKEKKAAQTTAAPAAAAAAASSAKKHKKSS